MTSIKGYETFVKIEPIDKGLSNDKKYYIETAGDQRLILRVSNISEYDRKKAAYERMQLMAVHGIPMSCPVDFGICDDGKSVYQLLTWCDGDSLETMLPLFSEAEQYAVGLKAGEILQKIHDVPISETDKTSEDWNECYSSFIDGSIQAFHESGVKIDSAEIILDYFNGNRHLLKTRPQCYMHGDYHVGNMMYSAETRELYIIDWEIHLFNSYGDPWKEISMQETPHFTTGMIRGYFGGEPPEDYWRIFAFYTSIGAVSAIPWAYYGHPELLDSIIQHNTDVLQWFENMKNTVPSWYLKDYHVEHIIGVSIPLKKPFDFSFIDKYGTVFKVIDNIYSGNICFGVENGGKRYFVKFAGAPKKMFNSFEPEQAIEWLKEAAQVYKDLSHESLIKFIKGEETGGGYANIFEWIDAECIGYPSPPSRQRFLNLPVEAKMQAFEDILNFHAHVAKKGYVAIDFYADQILYDFEKDKTIICDIDFYQKSPYYGDKGTWGSSNFVSPEECTPDLRINEITMVYTMGATAFCIFTDYDRSPEAWPLSPELYAVAKHAVSDERNLRQQSIEQFIQEWRASKN